MRFIADSMLGKLAKYLRMIGLSTLYPPPTSPIEIVRLSEEENRVILTRSVVFIRDFKPRLFLLIKSQDFSEQLIQVLKAYRISPDAKSFFTLCLFCDAPVIHKDKNELREQIPESVMLYASDFRRCPSCSRIYWRGGQTRRMEKKLCQILRMGNIM